MATLRSHFRYLQATKRTIAQQILQLKLNRELLTGSLYGFIIQTFDAIFPAHYFICPTYVVVSYRIECTH